MSPRASEGSRGFAVTLLHVHDGGLPPARHARHSREESDAQLVDAVRRGDRARFEVLYTRHVAGVRAAISDNVRDPELAADLTQEAFTRALESLPRLVNTERFRPWLLSIARHTAVDGRRAGARAPRALPDSPEPVDPLPGPAELAELVDLAELVRGCVTGLSRRDATAVGLIALGFSVADVAAELGLNHGAAKVALHRARNRLRAALLLSVLTRRNAPACAEAQRIPDADLVELARHFETCAECAEAAARETLDDA